MRLASFTHAGRATFGMLTDGGLVDLGARTGLGGLKQALAAPQVLAPFAGLAPDVDAEAVTWAPPIPDPSHIIGIGLNTRSHFDETAALMKRTAGDFPKTPRLFLRSPFSQVGHRADLIIPQVSARLDYEGEIAVVIGKPARYVARARAAEHIAGFACYNDGSVRDFQAHSNQVTAGKNFARSGAFGPCLVTPDEAGDALGLSLETRVNGEVRQRLTMDDLIFDFADLIAYISQIFPLQPGDVILTGSPAGIGAVAGAWLVEGDVVEIASPQLGTLMNRVAREPAAALA